MTLDWPRITIVTPSYNQGRFLEATIRSVIGQGYPNLEYIIVDGGSTDNSVDIIRGYAESLAFWASEPDNGPAHAINKGFAHASGEILAWLNSDDIYEPDTLQAVARAFIQNEDVTVVFGDCYMVDEAGGILGTFKAEDEPFHRKLQFWRGWRIPQPTVFVSRRVWEEVGPLNESLCYAFDYEWFLRIAQRHRFVHLGRVMAGYRLHAQSKTGMDWETSRHRFYPECLRASRPYWGTWRQFRYWQYWGGYLLSPVRRRLGAWKAKITRWRRMMLPGYGDQEQG